MCFWKRLRNRQLNKNRGKRRPVCLFFSSRFIAALAHQRRLPLWISISLSEVRPTDSIGDERWESSKQGKKMHAGRKEDRLADEQKDVFTSVLYLAAHILTGPIFWNLIDVAHFDTDLIRWLFLAKHGCKAAQTDNSKRFGVMIKTCLEHGWEPRIGGKWRIRNSWDCLYCRWVGVETGVSFTRNFSFKMTQCYDGCVSILICILRTWLEKFMQTAVIGIKSPWSVSKFERSLEVFFCV